MTKKLIIFALAGVLLCTTACGATKEDQRLIEAIQEMGREQDALNSDITKLKEDKETLQTKLEKSHLDLFALQGDLDTVTKEFKSYKDKMAPYEAMSAAEAEAQAAKLAAEKAEAEKALKEQKAAEKAEKERLAKEKAEKAAAEEAKGYETGITFSQLARTPDKYLAKKVKFKGKVIQVIEGDSETNIRLAINDDYDQIVLGFYLSDLVSSRILEDDTITIYGLSGGLHSYKSTMGGTITIPSILIDRIDQ